MLNTAPQKPRAQAQRDRLLDAAAEVFLEHGFGIATVDVIAAKAKASKKTLYSYFGSKEEIFTATVEHLCQRTLLPLRQLEIDEKDPENLLVIFGVRLIAQILSPEAIAIHRMAISEATRFPELSRLFYRTGPATAQSILTKRLAALQDAGGTQLGNPETIASLFIQMILGEAQRKVALAVSPPPSPEEAMAHASMVSDLLLRGLGVIVAPPGRDRQAGRRMV